MRKTEHLLLLAWMMTTGLVIYGFVVTTDTGLIQAMVATDKSMISIVVIAIYFVGLSHSLLRTLNLSHELNVTRRTELNLINTGEPVACDEDGRLCLVDSGRVLPESFVSRYVADLLSAKHTERDPASKSVTSADILEAHASRLRGKNEFGWFLIDFLLKVGFLGTLIGFILMLGSVSQNEILDASAMQRVLRQMSFGMSTALNTTLVSLVGGILLSIPYYLLGRGLEELLETTINLTDVHILPRLHKS
ncbi:MAG TPA: MotA/TolQ/ExbB proton channel family protein [Gammaproteobacteria bacterium]|nr:MotA/TolQ/ExbB proton channel family protein [Gammaproteobacteria bacterium]